MVELSDVETDAVCLWTNDIRNRRDKTPSGFRKGSKKIRFLEHEEDTIRNERNNAVFNVDNDDTIITIL